MGPAVGDLAKATDALMLPDQSKKQRAKKLANLVPGAKITEAGREITADLIEEILP